MKADRRGFLRGLGALLVTTALLPPELLLPEDEVTLALMPTWASTAEIEAWLHEVVLPAAQRALVDQQFTVSAGTFHGMRWVDDARDA